MARTTISTVVERIRHKMQSGYRYEVSVLGVNVDAVTDTITLLYTLPPNLREGSVISINTETMRVLEIDAAAKELTVIRGWHGSVATAHLAGREVWINPRFTANDIFESMHEEMAAWPESLFRVLTFEGSWTAGSETVELPAAWSTIYGLVDVRYRMDSAGYVTWPSEATNFPRLAGRVVRGDASTWTEGPTSGIYFRPTDSHGSGGSLLFSAAAPFDLTGFDYDNDLVTDCGMQLSMLDVLMMGVQLRLMPDQEIARSDRRGQDDSRRAEEVPPEAALTAVRALYPIYQRRRQEEGAKLRALYPWVIA